MMMRFNLNVRLILTGFGFALAAIFLMGPLGEAGSVTGQQLGPESTQNRTGYFLQTGLDFLPSPSSGSDRTARLYFVNGHRFTPQTSVGVGVGFTPYNDPLSLIPFFFDFNYRFSEDGVSPVLFLRAGYNFAVKYDDSLIMDDFSGGLLFHPGVGLEFPVSSQFDLYLNAGYNVDNSSYQFQSWGNQTVVNDLSFRRLSIGMGFKLNP
jgi:hypothetical protein